MKKICNFRPIALFSLSLIIGGYCFALSNFREYIFGITIALIALVVIGGVVGLIITKKIRPIIIALTCFLIPFCLGGTLANCQVKKLLETHDLNGYYIISGKVITGGNHEYGYKCYLDDVTLTEVDTGEVHKVDGEVSFYAPKENPLEVYDGDEITFLGEYEYSYEDSCDDNPLSADTFTARVYATNDISVVEGSGIKYNILKWGKNQLNSVMDKNEADIAYAMLFGDKLLMDGELKESYKISGLSHILAVSGLHVGFMIAILGFFLNRIIKNKWVNSGLLLALLIFYAYICDWAPSVLRAISMCAIVLLSKCVFEQYDALNSLAIACAINIFVSPLNIFNVGFLLSFSVTFTIFSLSLPLKKLFAKRMPEKVASSLGLSISAWLGSVPVILLYFETLSMYAVIVNFLILPTISIVFTCLVLGLGLSIIPGSAWLFLAVPNYLIKGLNLVIEGIASLKFAILPLSSSFVIMLLGMIAIAFASQYNLIKRKGLYAGVLCIGFVACALVYSLV